MLALKTINITKSYGKKKVLQGLNMNIPKLGIYGFLGINGAGKTTTFGILSGFIKKDKGDFKADGTVSVLPQDAKFYSGRSISSQLKLFGLLSGVKKKDIKKEVERILEMVDLTSQVKKTPDQLSHGMIKRLAIAQSLIGNPDIILLDEPLAGLDPQNVYEMKKVIKNAKKKSTIVLSSHILADIEEICDTIGIIEKGKIQFEGSIEEITKAEATINYIISKNIDLTIFDYLKNQYEIKFDSDKKKLKINYNSTEVNIEKVNSEIINILLKKGVGIIEIKKGDSLEKGFLELLKK